MHRSVQICVTTNEGAHALVRVNAADGTGLIVYDGQRLRVWLGEFKSLACELQIAQESIARFDIPADTAYPLTSAAGESVVMPLNLAAAVTIAGIMLLTG